MDIISVISESWDDSGEYTVTLRCGCKFGIAQYYPSVSFCGYHQGEINSQPQDAKYE